MKNARSSIIFVLSVFIWPIYAVPVVERSSEFLVSQWTTENGLPQDTVTSIVQTRDGYIWVGTFGGLARFDGVSFTIFDAASTPSLTSNRIVSLFEDSHGTLWIGAQTGEVFFLKDLKFHSLELLDGLRRSTVWAFEEDNLGRLIIASGSGLETLDFDETGNIKSDSRVLLSRSASTRLAKSPDGQIWARVGSEMFFVRNNELIRSSDVGMHFPEKLFQFAFTPSGEALMGSMTTLGVVGRNKYSELLPLVYRDHRSLISLGVHNGHFWYQQAGELFEFSENSGVRYDLSKYIEGGSRQLFFDKEENIWIGTELNGLVKLRQRSIGLLSKVVGRDINGVFSLVEDRQGGVWLAAGEELLYVLGDQIRKITEVENAGRFPFVRSVATDGNGILWVGGTKGLYFLRQEKLVPVPGLEKKHIQSLFFDDQHRLWIGSNDGLTTLDEGSYKNYTAAEGLADNNINYITQTRDRSIWVGTSHGVSIVGDEIKNLTVKDGLTADDVRDIQEDADGTMWIATYGGGISRLRDGHISSIQQRSGLPNNFVSRILITDDRLWILTNVGIVALDKDVINDVADGKIPFLVGTKYDKADGMPSSEANGGHQKAGIQTSDGRLWFPMLKDVVILDPRSKNSGPPSVVIENAYARSNSNENRPSSSIFDPRVPFTIPDGLRNLEIRYTGLSFSKPEDIRFYYMLEGLDDGWIDAGNRRTAFYPYLPAGRYQFVVKALSADGLWSTASAKVDVVVVQRFWETWWFLAIAALMAIGITAFFVYMNTRRYRERKAQQAEFSRKLINAQEAERDRLASELHDGLGQSLLLIRNWASLSLSANPSPDLVGDNLVKIEEAAANSITEAREMAQHLSPKLIKRRGLTEAILHIADQIQDATGISIETDIDNIDGLFDEETEVYLYRIVQEALSNTVRHSKSSDAILTIRSENEMVEIAVTDHGKGFDAESELINTGHRGIGLQSIAERVRLIGGDLAVRSAPGRGTRVSVKLTLDH